MVLMITGISLFIRNGRRRKVLVALSEGEKRADDVMASAQFKDKSYVKKLLRGLQRMKFVEKFGDGNIVYYRITKKGRDFLSKQTIEEVV